LARPYTTIYPERLGLLRLATGLTLADTSKPEAHFPTRLKILDYRLDVPFFAKLFPVGLAKKVLPFLFRPKLRIIISFSWLFCLFVFFFWK